MFISGLSTFNSFLCRRPHSPAWLREAEAAGIPEESVPAKETWDARNNNWRVNIYSCMWDAPAKLGYPKHDFTPFSYTLQMLRYNLIWLLGHNHTTNYQSHSILQHTTVSAAFLVHVCWFWCPWSHSCWSHWFTAPDDAGRASKTCQRGWDAGVVLAVQGNPSWTALSFQKANSFFLGLGCPLVCFN